MNLRSKQSLSDFSEKELMQFIIANQVLMMREFRQLSAKISQIEPEIKKQNPDFKFQYEPLGHFQIDFEQMIKSTESILNQADEYLNQSDTEKGFFRL